MSRLFKLRRVDRLEMAVMNKAGSVVVGYHGEDVFVLVLRRVCRLGGLAMAVLCSMWVVLIPSIITANAS